MSGPRDDLGQSSDQGLSDVEGTIDSDSETPPVENLSEKATSASIAQLIESINLDCLVAGGVEITSPSSFSSDCDEPGLDEEIESVHNGGFFDGIVGVPLRGNEVDVVPPCGTSGIDADAADGVPLSVENLKDEKDDVPSGSVGESTAVKEIVEDSCQDSSPRALGFKEVSSKGTDGARASSKDSTDAGSSSSTAGPLMVLGIRKPLTGWEKLNQLAGGTPDLEIQTTIQNTYQSAIQSATGNFVTRGGNGRKVANLVVNNSKSRKDGVARAGNVTSGISTNNIRVSNNALKGGVRVSNTYGGVSRESRESSKESIHGTPSKEDSLPEYCHSLKGSPNDSRESSREGAKGMTEGNTRNDRRLLRSSSRDGHGNRVEEFLKILKAEAARYADGETINKQIRRKIVDLRNLDIQPTKRVRTLVRGEADIRTASAFGRMFCGEHDGEHSSSEEELEEVDAWGPNATRASSALSSKMPSVFACNTRNNVPLGNSSVVTTTNDVGNNKKSIFRSSSNPIVAIGNTNTIVRKSSSSNINNGTVIVSNTTGPIGVSNRRNLSKNALQQAVTILGKLASRANSVKITANTEAASVLGAGPASTSALLTGATNASPTITAKSSPTEPTNTAAAIIGANNVGVTNASSHTDEESFPPILIPSITNNEAKRAKMSRAKPNHTVNKSNLTDDFANNSKPNPAINPSGGNPSGQIQTLEGSPGETNASRSTSSTIGPGNMPSTMNVTGTGDAPSVKNSAVMGSPVMTCSVTGMESKSLASTGIVAITTSSPNITAKSANITAATSTKITAGGPSASITNHPSNATADVASNTTANTVATRASKPTANTVATLASNTTMVSTAVTNVESDEPMNAPGTFAKAFDESFKSSTGIVSKLIHDGTKAIQKEPIPPKPQAQPETVSKAKATAGGVFKGGKAQKPPLVYGYGIPTAKPKAAVVPGQPPIGPVMKEAPTVPKTSPAKGPATQAKHGAVVGGSSPAPPGPQLPSSVVAGPSPVTSPAVKAASGVSPVLTAIAVEAASGVSPMPTAIAVEATSGVSPVPTATASAALPSVVPAASALEAQVSSASTSSNSSPKAEAESTPHAPVQGPSPAPCTPSPAIQPTQSVPQAGAQSTAQSGATQSQTATPQAQQKGAPHKGAKPVYGGQAMIDPYTGAAVPVYPYGAQMSAMQMGKGNMGWDVMYYQPDLGYNNYTHQPSYMMGKGAYSSNMAPSLVYNAGGNMASNNMATANMHYNTGTYPLNGTNNLSMNGMNSMGGMNPMAGMNTIAGINTMAGMSTMGGMSNMGMNTMPNNMGSMNTMAGSIANTMGTVPSGSRNTMVNPYDGYGMEEDSSSDEDAKAKKAKKKEKKKQKKAKKEKKKNKEDENKNDDDSVGDRESIGEKDWLGGKEDGKEDDLKKEGSQESKDGSQAEKGVSQVEKEPSGSDMDDYISTKDVLKNMPDALATAGPSGEVAPIPALLSACGTSTWAAASRSDAVGNSGDVDVVGNSDARGNPASGDVDKLQSPEIQFQLEMCRERFRVRGFQDRISDYEKMPMFEDFVKAQALWDTLTHVEKHKLKREHADIASKVIMTGNHTEKEAENHTPSSSVIDEKNRNAATTGNTSPDQSGNQTDNRKRRHAEDGLGNSKANPSKQASSTSQVSSKPSNNNEPLQQQRSTTNSVSSNDTADFISSKRRRQNFPDSRNIDSNAGNIGSNAGAKAHNTSSTANRTANDAAITSRNKMVPTRSQRVYATLDELGTHPTKQPARVILVPNPRSREASIDGADRTLDRPLSGRQTGGRGSTMRVADRVADARNAAASRAQQHSISGSSGNNDSSTNAVPPVRNDRESASADQQRNNNVGDIVGQQKHNSKHNFEASTMRTVDSSRQNKDLPGASPRRSPRPPPQDSVSGENPAKNRDPTRNPSHGRNRITSGHSSSSTNTNNLQTSTQNGKCEIPSVGGMKLPTLSRVSNRVSNVRGCRGQSHARSNGPTNARSSVPISSPGKGHEQLANNVLNSMEVKSTSNLKSVSSSTARKHEGNVIGTNPPDRPAFSSSSSSAPIVTNQGTINKRKREDYSMQERSAKNAKKDEPGKEHSKNDPKVKASPTKSFRASPKSSLKCSPACSRTRSNTNRKTAKGTSSNSKGNAKASSKGNPKATKGKSKARSKATNDSKASGSGGTNVRVVESEDANKSKSPSTYERKTSNESSKPPTTYERKGECSKPPTTYERKNESSKPPTTYERKANESSKPPATYERKTNDSKQPGQTIAAPAWSSSDYETESDADSKKTIASPKDDPKQGKPIVVNSAVNPKSTTAKATSNVLKPTISGGKTKEKTSESDILLSTLIGNSNKQDAGDGLFGGTAGTAGTCTDAELFAWLGGLPVVPQQEVYDPNKLLSAVSAVTASPKLPVAATVSVAGPVSGSPKLPNAVTGSPVTVDGDLWSLGDV